MSPPVTLTRLCLAADGRVKANFSDNSVLLLSANGGAFVHSSGSEPPCRQLSDYAISWYAPKLAVALQFRNMHWDTPYWCPALKGTAQSHAGHPPAMTLGYRLGEVWWPATAADAWTSGLVQQLADGSLAVSATDSSARIVFQGNRQRMAVCYPLLSSVSEGQYHYVWQTQVFSVTNHPPRWSPAVSLLLEVAQQHWDQTQPSALQGTEFISTSTPSQGHAHAHDPTSTQPPASSTSHQPQYPHQPQDHQSNKGYVTSHTSQSSTCPWPSPPSSTHHTAGALALGPVQQNQQAAARSTALPESHLRSQPHAPDKFPPDSWWFEPSLVLFPNDELLLLEWTPDATYEFLPATQEVDVWLHSDDSCICSERRGRFVRHVVTQPQLQHKLYAASCVPEHVWVEDGPQEGQTINTMRRCPLGRYTSHALKFRERMYAVMSSHQLAAELHSYTGSDVSHVPDQMPWNSPGHQGFGALSEEVVDCSELPGQGSFTAYADGRVRAFFVDRTIMHLNPKQSHCKVILPDGKRLMVATDNPVGMEQHMQLVLDYCRWAFKAPEERDHLAKAHAMANVQAAASQRMAQLLDWSLSSSSPSKTHIAAREYSRPPEDQSRLSIHEQIAEMLSRNAELVSQL